MWLKRFYFRLRGLWQAEIINGEIEEELQFHLQMLTEENIRQGMSPEDARANAKRRFGQMQQIKEQGYAVRGGG
ncbi:MAG: permease prefix domain 1-containing protein, partial [Pyrinomonadaceae bacterium]